MLAEMIFQVNQGHINLKSSLYREPQGPQGKGLVAVVAAGVTLDSGEREDSDASGSISEQTSLLGENNVF